MKRRRLPAWAITWQWRSRRPAPLSMVYAPPPRRSFCPAPRCIPTPPRVPTRSGWPPSVSSVPVGPLPGSLLPSRFRTWSLRPSFQQPAFPAWVGRNRSERVPWLKPCTCLSDPQPRPAPLSRQRPQQPVFRPLRRSCLTCGWPGSPGSPTPRTRLMLWRAASPAAERLFRGGRTRKSRPLLGILPGRDPRSGNSSRSGSTSLRLNSKSLPPPASTCPCRRRRPARRMPPSVSSPSRKCGLWASCALRLRHTRSRGCCPPRRCCLPAGRLERPRERLCVQVPSPWPNSP